MFAPPRLHPFLFGAMLALGALAGPAAAAAAADDDADAHAAPTPLHPDLSGIWNLDPKASGDLAGFGAALGGMRPAGGPGREGAPNGRGDGGGMGRPGGGMGRPGGGMGGGGMAGGGGGMGGPGGGMSGAGGVMGGPRGGNGGGGAGGFMPADELGAGGDGGPGGDEAGLETRRDGGGPAATFARAARQLLISYRDGVLEIVDGTDRSEAWVVGGDAGPAAGAGGGSGPGGGGPPPRRQMRASWDGEVLVLAPPEGMPGVVRRLALKNEGRRLAVDLSAPGADGKPLTVHLEYAAVQ